MADPSEIIPDELRERAEGYTDRNGSEPHLEPEPDPFTREPLRAADMALARALAELNLKASANQAMLAIVIVALVAVLVEVERIRRANG